MAARRDKVMFDNLELTGTIQKGFVEEWPEGRHVVHEFPGLDGGLCIDQGLRPRQIIIPMCLFPYERASDLTLVKASLLQIAKEKRQFTLRVEIGEDKTRETPTYTGCKLRALVPRSDVIPDIAGTCGGGVFVEWDLVVVQYEV